MPNVPNERLCSIWGHSTDSCYILVNDFCEQHLGKEFWNSKTDDEKIGIIDLISEYIEDYINERTYNEVQKGTYNSTVEDFKITFSREKIAKSGLFVAKKMYSVRSLWVEGDRTDKVTVTGMTVVRGDSSEAVRSRLKDIMYRILRDEPSKDISEKVKQYKKELMKATPEEIAANIGVNNMRKWTSSEGRPLKGTPWHVKGAINFNNLLKSLELTKRYETINEGIKAKVVYVKPNKWNYRIITFYDWPKEFNKAISVDMNTMVDKFFVKKIEMLLKPAKRMDILNDLDSDLGLFFG